MESNIITIHSDNESFPVNGRELHAGLGINTRYNDWFPRVCEYGFEKGKDFQEVLLKNEQNPTGGRPATDHQLSLSMAKEICMLQRTEIGRSIRQYLISVEDAWNTPELVMARALKIADKQITESKQTIARLEVKITEDAPKVSFYDRMADSTQHYPMAYLARALTQNGYKVGRTALFQRLRAEEYLYKSAANKNLPTQKSVELGLFVVILSQHNENGVTMTTPTTYVTAKGVDYFIRKYCQHPTGLSRATVKPRLVSPEPQSEAPFMRSFFGN